MTCPNLLYPSCVRCKPSGEYLSLNDLTVSGILPHRYKSITGIEYLAPTFITASTYSINRFPYVFVLSTPRCIGVIKTVLEFGKLAINPSHNTFKPP